MPPAVIGGAIAGVGAIGSAVIGSSAASKAAKAQTQAADAASQTQRDIFERQTELQEPFRQGGLTAQNRLLTLLGLSPVGGSNAMGGTDWNAFAQALDPAAKADYQKYWTGGPGSLGNLTPAEYAKYYYENDLSFKRGEHLGVDGKPYAQADPNYSGIDLSRFQAGGSAPTGSADPDFGKYARDFSMQDFVEDPGYAFRMSEGMKALNNSMAARGMGVSGANIKGALRYGQDLGSQEYQNAFNRYQVNRSNQLNPLQSLMGAGQTSANTLTNAAGNMGNNISELQTQAGNARASGYVGRANALTNALGSGFNTYLNYQNSNAMNRFLNGGGGSGGGGISTFGVDNYDYSMGG